MARASFGLLAIALLGCAAWLVLRSHPAAVITDSSAPTAPGSAETASGNRTLGTSAADDPGHGSDPARASAPPARGVSAPAEPASPRAAAAVAARAGGAATADAAATPASAASPATPSGARTGSIGPAGAGAGAAGADAGSPMPSSHPPVGDAADGEDPPQPRRSDPHLAGGVWIIGGPKQRPFAPTAPQGPNGDG